MRPKQTPSSENRPSPPKAERSPTGRLPEKLPAMFGRYRLLKVLGRGGMGAVYLAHDTQLDRPVALKVPFFTASDGPQVMERFLREARAAATLQHANVCPVYDVGQIDGLHYLTMAYIEGRALADVLQTQKKPVALRQAAALVRKLALALAEAHRKKVIHRDLKPANVMLTKRGEPVIMDFGLARRGGEAEARLTQAGAIMGTPSYMPPEQARGDPDEMGPACDVYSLGVILYELLTGQVPFKGDPIAILGQLLTEPPKPPSTLRSDVDPKMETICLKAMAKKPEDRFASMTEFAAALADYLKATEQTLAAEGPAAELPFAETAGQTQLAACQEERKSGCGSVLAVLLALLSLAGAGGAIYYLATNKGQFQVELSDPKATVEVKVDGVAVPIPSTEQPLALNPGEHQLEVTGAGYLPFTKSFTIQRGQPEVVRVTLVPNMGRVRFQVSDPHIKLNLTLDGKPVSVEDAIAGLSLPAGKHTLEGRPLVFVPFTLPFEVKPGGEEVLPICLSWHPKGLASGTIAAPDLAKVKPLYQDLFDEPAKSGLPVGANAYDSIRSYKDGRYLLEVKRTNSFATVPLPTGSKDKNALAPSQTPASIACRLVGSCDQPQGQWGLLVSNGAFQAAMNRVQVLVTTTGSLSVRVHNGGAGGGGDLPELTFPHAKVKEGVKNQNALLIVLRGRFLELYANGVAVHDPIVLDWEILNPHVYLTARSGPQKVVAEFEEVTIWSGSEVVPPKRSATRIRP
jgi:predicted Ser/Thr protein kinase